MEGPPAHGILLEPDLLLYSLSANGGSFDLESWLVGRFCCGVVQGVLGERAFDLVNQIGRITILRRIAGGRGFMKGEER